MLIFFQTFLNFSSLVFVYSVLDLKSLKYLVQSIDT